jgi:hypothetical protein
MNAAVDIKKLGANGVLPIKLGFNGAYFDLEIVGGPFDKYRPGVNGDVGVCVRAERVPATADIRLPIHDFEVPENEADVDAAIEETLGALLAGKRVYVGCMGGWGRTGLFLALLAKTCGYEDPIAYVRANYTPRAVETKEQEAFVRSFDVRPLQRRLFWAAWSTRWTRLWFWWT